MTLQQFEHLCENVLPAELLCGEESQSILRDIFSVFTGSAEDMIEDKAEKNPFEVDP